MQRDQHKLDTCKSHAVKAKEAAEILISHLHHPDSPLASPADIMAAAKVLEASGCYIRRAVKAMTDEG